MKKLDGTELNGKRIKLVDVSEAMFYLPFTSQHVPLI